MDKNPSDKPLNQENHGEATFFETLCKRHQEIHRMHQEFHRKHREFHARHEKIHRRHSELYRYNKYVMFLRPVIMLINLGILYLLFRLFGLKAISLFFAAFIASIAIMQFIFFRRIEKRILAPVDSLIHGVQEIAQGNYTVKVEGDVPNDIGTLIHSFNEMARKLQENEKLKAEYEENRKALIANISHDLKTPMTSIQGYLEALLEGVVRPEKVEGYLKTIYHNTIYTNKLIDDLFLFTKLDMQKLDFQFVHVPLRAFMHDLFQEFRFELEERQCQFAYTDCLENDCFVYLDGKRIQQAIWNIIGNAVKYGPKKDLAITVRLYRQEDITCIDISDNGSGIRQDELPHIFDRFYRIDHERTKDFMSTGLGLAIAKELIEAHGGSIAVSSIEGEGTCFTIILPINTSPQPITHHAADQS